MASPLRIIFAGTPDFAAVSLAALINSEYEVVAVYTQPDRPAGRGRKLRASPVKELALEHKIPVIQPVSLKETAEQETLRNFNADVMVVAAYGLILPQAVLDIPRYGCLNIHASLLPRWRGAAPIQRAISAGDDTSGITIMQMNAGLDTGDILSLAPCEITDNDTGGTLHDRLAELGASILLTTLSDMLNDQLSPKVQNDALATYAHKINKQDAQIDWTQPAKNIEQMIRAFNPWPVAYTIYNDKPLRFWLAHVLETPATDKPGTVIQCAKQGLDVNCGEGQIRITKLQPAGSKAMDIQAFLNGHADLLQPGSVFGNGSSN